MRVHTTTPSICIIESAQNVARCVASLNPNEFKVGESLRSAKLQNFAPGAYVYIGVRVSEKYKFIVTVEALNATNVDPFMNSAVEWSYGHQHKASEAVGPVGIIPTPVLTDEDVPAVVASPKPTINPDYFYISTEHQQVADLSLKMLKKWPTKPVKVLAFGESGYGKTSLGQYIAKTADMDYFRMNCATVRDPEEWFGQRAASEGTTYFERSTFVQKMEAGNCVIILDEFNRMEPWIANSLFPLLDDDAKTTVFNQEFKVGPNVIFFATINLGFEYTGTFTMDAAISNRFNFFVEVGELERSVEKAILVNRFGLSATEVDFIVSSASAIRKLKMIGCTLRTTIQVAEAVSSGATVRQAWQHVFVYRCPQDTGVSNVRKEVVDVLNSITGHYI